MELKNIIYITKKNLYLVKNLLFFAENIFFEAIKKLFFTKKCVSSLKMQLKVPFSCHLHFEKWGFITAQNRVKKSQI